MNELSYNEYKEEVENEIATTDLLNEVREQFPDEVTIPYGSIISADELYSKWVDDLRLEVNSENWSVVAGRAEDLENFEGEYVGEDLYFASDAYLDDEPLYMGEILDN